MDFLEEEADLCDLPPEVSLLWALSLVFSPDDENDICKKMLEAEEEEKEEAEEEEEEEEEGEEEHESQCSMLDPEEKQEVDIKEVITVPQDIENRGTLVDEVKFVPQQQQQQQQSVRGNNSILRNLRLPKRSSIRSSGSGSSGSSFGSLSRARSKILKTVTKSIRRKRDSCSDDATQSPLSASNSISEFSEKDTESDNASFSKEENEQRIGKCGAPIMLAPTKQRSLTNLTSSLDETESTTCPEDDLDENHTPPSSTNVSPKLSPVLHQCRDKVPQINHNHPSVLHSMRSRLQTLDTNIPDKKHKESIQQPKRKNERFRNQRSMMPPPLPPSYRLNKTKMTKAPPRSPMSKLRSALGRAPSDRTVQSFS